MRTIFVDTSYWIARSNRRDQWHQSAKDLTSSLGNIHLLTTELVLVEYLNYFSEYGAEMREKIAMTVRKVLEKQNLQVVWQSQDLFESGLALYRIRLDKGYSLTDCVSMMVMRQAGIQEVVTHDRHFSQEGFTILL
jgi:uncharacterized protein